MDGMYGNMVLDIHMEDIEKALKIGNHVWWLEKGRGSD